MRVLVSEHNRALAYLCDVVFKNVCLQNRRTVGETRKGAGEEGEAIGSAVGQEAEKGE